jgi:hypothetical protein
MKTGIAANIRSELKRLDEAFIEATQSKYYEKASEIRFEKHKLKLRLFMEREFHH